MRIIPILIFHVFVSCVCAEYFGKNKVQYESFDFQILKTKQFDIYYYREATEAVYDAARMLERWNRRLKLVFDYNLPKNQPIILYANHADFQQTNTIGSQIPQETGGFTEGFMNRIVIPLTGIYSENDQVLGHELTHAFHYTLMKESEYGITASQQIPLWFIEGMSEYLTIGSLSPHTSMWLRDALLFDDLPSITQISKNSEYFPYRYGHALWAYIGGTFGDRITGILFKAILNLGWFNTFSTVLGTDTDTLSLQWQQAVREAYEPVLEGRSKPQATGKRIIEDPSINLSPSISPDGKHVAFLSTKDLFSIDLFLADIQSGKIIKKLASSQTDEHFDALRFINSSGAWSPDGKSFAFPVYKRGNNSIAIINIQKTGIKKIYDFSDITEITAVSWSPDSRKLVISGTKGAISDLYLLDLQTSSCAQLTNDRYAQIQPSWSPDGRQIVFSTDLGSNTCFDSLIFSPPKIGLYNLDTKETSLISIAPWAKHINPQFSVDGKDIFFISDPDGISDLYRYSTETDEFFRITKIATGITGLSELSSAMSVASKSGQIVFSVFENSDYKIQCLEKDQTDGESFSPNRLDYIQNVTLPPHKKHDALVDRYLTSPLDGLPRDTSSFDSYKYRPRLKLLYAGQLAAGISASPLGVGMAGGVSFLFSDILGNNYLGLGAMLNGTVKDFGAEAFYINTEKRLNWGISLSRIPYISSRAVLDSDSASENGDLQRITFIDQRTYENQISLIAQYPFSSYRRFEFSTAYERISYDYDAERIYALDGMIVDRERGVVSETEPLPLDLFSNSVAYVGDYSFFGFTGPVKGFRFRYELDPTIGSLHFLSALADFRAYFLFRQLTFAFRLMHFGRYLKDSESNYLSLLFLGYETWVRGYSFYSFDFGRCSDSLGNCPEFDRLLGSRIGVMNLELRYPLFGNKQFGLFNFPYLPTELAVFLDGGVAWTKKNHPVFKLNGSSNERTPVLSLGATTRFNLFGLLVLQIYYAYPFQRSDGEGNWGFFLAPGW